MSTRIIIIDYVVPGYGGDKPDTCVHCPRHDRKQGSCQHFGPLVLKPKTKSTYQRHSKCIRAEERTRHAAISQLMQEGDFER